MRADLFQDRKCIHIKLDKSTHAAMRRELFQHNLSMQDVFDEFAKLLASGDRGAMGILNRLVIKKVNDKIAGLTPRRQLDRSIDELDHELLYNMINNLQEVDKNDISGEDDEIL